MANRGSRSTHRPEPGQAVEVSAIFGNSLTSMRHLVEPSRGRQGHLAWLSLSLLVIGATLLLASATVFRQAVQLAGENHRDLLAHVQAQNAAHEFRPETLHPGWEFLGLGGAIGGLLLITFGIWRRREGPRPSSFRIGQTRACDYPAALESGAAFDLVEDGEDGFALSVPEDWSVDHCEGSGSWTLPEAQSGFRRTALPQDFALHLRSGDHRFVIRSVVAPRRQSLPLLAAVDSRFTSYLGGATITVLALVFALDSHFQVESSLYSDLFDADLRHGDYRIAAKEKPILRPALTYGRPGSASGGTGEAMRGAAGAMGSPKPQRAMGRYAMKKEKDLAPQLARSQVLADVREAGILGVLKRRPTFATLDASHAFSSGLDQENLYGGLIGNEVGEASGAWGFSVVGVGTGGGGTGWGTIGSGRFGVLGHGAGSGSGWSSGHGNGGGRGHHPVAPGVIIGNASAIGDLDKNIIRRYVRRKLPRIEHCYERALIATPELEGEVTTSFQINPNGSVLAASTTGIDDEEMHDCISGALKSIQFPKPKNGGYVNVNYPFTFQQTP